MAIFGETRLRLLVNGTFVTTFVKETNNWDIFLNHFFAVLFIFYLLVGTTINPLILLYHSKQKKSLARTLFLMISSMDLIRSIYFSSIFIPKLLAPMKDIEMFIDYSYEVLFAQFNTLLVSFLGIENYVLVALCCVRYLAIKYPLLSKKRIKIVTFSAITLRLLLNVSVCISKYFIKPLLFIRAGQIIVSGNPQYIQRIMEPVIRIDLALYVMITVVGSVFCGLTIRHLKRVDTASSEASEKKVVKSIKSITVMNFFNIFVILFYLVSNIFILNGRSYSTSQQLLYFMTSISVNLTQSIFNTVSFACISSSFQEFVRGFLATHFSRQYTSCHNALCSSN